jgi:hypothetical protein
MEESKIREFESSLTELSGGLEDLGDGKDVDALIAVIHRPGWTTQREQQFVMAMTESLVAQVKNVKLLKSLLIEESHSIGDGDQHRDDYTKKHPNAEPARAPQGPGGTEGGKGDPGPGDNFPPSKDDY